MADAVERLKAALADRYRIERELGAGGMATVYLAEDLKHHRQVAVKVLRADLAASLGPERFLREITIAANLQHPHVLPLYDSGQADGFLYFVMPYVEGPSLRQRLTREGQLPIADTVWILRDIADALAFAHLHGVVHRDIKPENVLLSGRHALVADFGVAKAVSEATGRPSLTGSGLAVGTPTYMAPEQAAPEGHPDHRADVYAFGVLAYELLAGRPPFAGTTPQAVLRAHATIPPEPIAAYRPGIPPALGALIMKCLEKLPADRWQSAEELIPPLEAVLTPNGRPPPAVTASGPLSAPPARLRWKGRVLGGVVVVVLAIAAASFVRWRGRPIKVVAQRVAVVPFENRSGAQGFPDYGLRVVETVTEAIGREAVAEPVPAAAIRDLVSGNVGRTGSDVATQIAGRTGAAFVLRGSFAPIGDRVEIRAELLRMPEGTERFSLSVPAAAPDSALATLAERVAVVLLLEKEWGPDVSWQGEYVPTSLTALRDLLRADEFLAASDTAGLGLYRRVVGREPAWGRAWAHMAYLQINAAGRWRAARSMLDSLRSETFSAGDRETVDFARAFLAGRTEEAYLLAKKRMVTRSSEWRPLLVVASYNSHRPREVVANAGFASESSYWAAPARRGFLVWAYNALGYALHELGQYQEQLALSSWMRDSAGIAAASVLTQELWAQAALGRIGAIDSTVARMEFAAVRGMTPCRAFVAATQLRAHGHESAAVRFFQKAITCYADRLARGDSSAGIADSYANALYYSGNYDRLAGIMPLVRSRCDESRVAFYAGLLAARRGNRAEVEHWVQVLEKVPTDNPYARGENQWSMAQMRAILGDRVGAIEHLRRAVQVGYRTWHVLEWESDFASLRGQPAFEEFARPKGP